MLLLLLVMLEGDVSNVARQRVARAAMQTMPSFPHHKTPDSHTHRHTYSHTQRHTGCLVSRPQVYEQQVAICWPWQQVRANKHAKARYAKLNAATLANTIHNVASLCPVPSPSPSPSLSLPAHLHRCVQRPHGANTHSFELESSSKVLRFKGLTLTRLQRQRQLHISGNGPSSIPGPQSALWLWL